MLTAPTNRSPTLKQPTMSHQFHLCQVKIPVGYSTMMMGGKHGPHSLLELYSWYQYGYLKDSLMIYHSQNKFRPLPLLSIMNAWRLDKPESFSMTMPTLKLAHLRVSYL
ncbi:hypothetical protein NC651_007511 [Populus alba x Populus x berolinensis]|nr:hypothetical protein NC651_007511 [Populus alba x Populus x berolinensis]